MTLISNIPATNFKDFYKTDHHRQYPKGTKVVYSNFTPRSARLAIKGGCVSSMYDDKIVWFGLQSFMMDFLVDHFNRTFFTRRKDKAVAAYKRRLDNALGEGAVPMDHIERLHDLGYLPLLIKSLPEGARVNIKTPVFTVTCTDPDFYWLVNDLETVFSCDIWKPTTVATIAFEYRRIYHKYAKLTGVDPMSALFQGHDFSMRGMSGRYDAAMSGMGHLTSFFGTDTIPAIDAAEIFYDANTDEELVGTSVPATEHSVMCLGGKGDEFKTFKRLINELYQQGIVSIVSDTWDFWKVITEYAPALIKYIEERGYVNGLSKVVFRPDSGCPIKILTGYTCFKVDGAESEAAVYAGAIAGGFEAYEFGGKYFTADGQNKELRECEVKGAVECLYDEFGGELTETGHKQIWDRVGLIYGDSITVKRAETILERLYQKGFASNASVFGHGSFSYQYVTRDTFGFAMKATYGEVEVEPGVVECRELEKDPVTDDGVKKSACGLLRVDLTDDGDYVLTDRVSKEQEEGGELIPVFKDGKILVNYSLAEIRDRVQSYLD